MRRIFQRMLYALRMVDEWQAWLLCFASGAAASLAYQPYDYWWVLPIALPLFYFLLEVSPARRHAVMRGFGFGYGFFMAGTWWIANALAVDKEQFGWLIPISVLGLSAVMALWFAVLGWLVWWRRCGDAFSDLLRFVVLWVVVEYLRTLGIFGFPWNLLGYTALVSNYASQAAAVAGPFGLSLMILLLALLPVVWLRPRINDMARIAYTACAIIVWIIAFGYGMARMPTRPELSDTRVRIVQPNIPQSMKWTQEGRLNSIRLHAQLSQMPAEGAVPPIVIWSETAAPFTFYQDSVWPSRLNELMPPRTTLITGVVRADDSGQNVKVWNSVAVIDADGNWRASYDKHQLVPFGEFVPLRDVLPINKITPGTTDFSRGKGPETLHIDAIPPFSPLICYEIIFPWIATDPKDRPSWLLNATNDAWYGDTAGPYQHFAMSRMRAIEQGLPLVRAANTGISAVIDPYGKPVRRLPLGQQGIIDQSLPRPLPATFYARNQEWPVLVALALLWGISWACQRVKKA